MTSETPIIDEYTRDGSPGFNIAPLPQSFRAAFAASDLFGLNPPVTFDEVKNVAAFIEYWKKEPTGRFLNEFPFVETERDLLAVRLLMIDFFDSDTNRHQFDSFFDANNTCELTNGVAFIRARGKIPFHRFLAALKHAGINGMRDMLVEILERVKVDRRAKMDAESQSSVLEFVRAKMEGRIADPDRIVGLLAAAGYNDFQSVEALGLQKGWRKSVEGLTNRDITMLSAAHWGRLF